MIKTGLEKGSSAGYEAEAEGFAELGMTSESKALKSIFFGQVRVCARACVYARMYVHVCYICDGVMAYSE